MILKYELFKDYIDRVVFKTFEEAFLDVIKREFVEQFVKIGLKEAKEHLHHIETEGYRKAIRDLYKALTGSDFPEQEARDQLTKALKPQT
jgi:intergrase/recombinase